VIRAALLLATLATPAFAGGVAVTTFTVAPTEHGGELGILTIKNLVSDQWGNGEPARFAVATPGGDVVVEYTPTQNDSPDPSDIVVVTAPDGYLAVPSEFRVDELHTVDVRILIFSGV
jgi:hypothetical protein